MRRDEPIMRTRALVDTVSAVLWAFLGVRRKTDFEKDVENRNPLHLLAVGLVLTFAFVGGLIILVNWVAQKG